MAYDGLSGTGTSPTGGGNTPNSLSFSRGSIRYDSPFLDMTSTFLPKYVKSMFRFISAYVMSDGFVSQCITKMSEYPITKLIYNEDKHNSIEDDQSVKFWQNLLEKKMKIMTSLKQAGMDYHAYGNSIVSICYPFKRMMRCKVCNETHAAEAMKLIFRNYRFYAKCPKCKVQREMAARDFSTNEVDKFRLVHWDLHHMEIKYNTITGDHFYYYTIPNDVVIAIQRGDMDIINSTRLEVIQAVRKRKQLRLVADNIFHMKRPGPQYISVMDRGWGVPATLAVMKDIFHVKILKKGNEMIAFDHIVPLRILFPMGTSEVSPHLTLNLATWRNNVEAEIEMWRRDPNRISIMPIPIGISNFAGDAKILMTTPEIRATEDAIITGLGIIPEIIRGGASWSGSNVSLRVVENSFLNHRETILDFLDFVVSNVATYLNKPPIDVKMSDFKMADDLEKKKIMLNAAVGPAEGRLFSKSTAVKELGFDPKNEFAKQMEELDRMVEMKVREAEGAAEAAGTSSIISAMYAADADSENRRRTEMHDRENQADRDKYRTSQSEESAQGATDEVASVATPEQQQVVSMPNLILILTNRFARLTKIDPDEFKIRMLNMKNSMPNLYSEVYNNLKEMNLIQADLMPDLAAVQKYTPGEIPSNIQGDTLANEQPSAIEAGATTPAQTNLGPQTKPLPEVLPPRSPKSPI